MLMYADEMCSGTSATCPSVPLCCWCDGGAASPYLQEMAQQDRPSWDRMSPIFSAALMFFYAETFIGVAHVVKWMFVLHVWKLCSFAGAVLRWWFFSVFSHDAAAVRLA